MLFALFFAKKTFGGERQATPFLETKDSNDRASWVFAR